MTKTYLLDGYNVIHHIPKFKLFLKHSLEQARQQLENTIRSFLARKQVKIILVYDGDRLIPESSPAAANFKIIFSKFPVKADAIIKNLIQRDQTPQQLCVVTHDQEICRFAQNHRAEFISPQEFFHRFLPRDEPLELEKKYNQSLSAEELKLWLNLFNDASPSTEENGGN